MRPFQMILIATFLLLGLGGLGFLATGGLSKNKVNPYGQQVIIWGTLDDAPFVQMLSNLQSTDKNAQVIRYVEKDYRTFDTELVNALSEGRGPDLIILSHEMLASYRAKIAPISYDSFPIRNFQDTYVDGAEIFMLQDGVYALPLSVDPLVMYWNKDTFATKGLVKPPATWEELTKVTVPQVVERDYSRTVTREAIAFGEYNNIRNARHILSLLFIQAGSVMARDTGERISVELNQSETVQGLPPAQAALSFFTQFSNPVHELYTWNRALPEDRNEFLAGDLAMYFGFASEIRSLQEGNPNLNFDVADVPQGQGVSVRKGYGTFYGLAQMRNSANPQGARNALYALATQQNAEGYAQAFGFGKVHRASYAVNESNPLAAVVAKASIVVRGWLDPNPGKSDSVFRQMVEDVVSGRSTVIGAIGDAEARLRQ